MQFDAAATATPVATTILDMYGLTIQAACIQNGTDVNVGLRINPSETAVLQANFNSTPASIRPPWAWPRPPTCRLR